MNNGINIVLAQSTPHDIFTPIRKQFGNARLYKLTESTEIPVDTGGLQELIRQVVESVLKLPTGEHFHIVSTGHPLASYIAYEALRQRGNTVSMLFFDGRTKRYLAAQDLAKQVGECLKRELKELKGGEK
jgi:hypothetical protein